MNQEPVLKIGSTCPKNLTKIIDIENDHVVVGFGKEFGARMPVTFHECEILFGIPSVIAQDAPRTLSN